MNHWSRLLPLQCAVFLVVTFAMLGCGGGSSALNSQFQPQVANLQDNFQFQTTGISNITQTLSYKWQNSGTGASINQACSVTPGTAFLHVMDTSGKAVYSGDLAANGTFTSITGTAGTWTIEVALTNATGTLNFRVQKM